MLSTMLTAYSLGGRIHITTFTILGFLFLCNFVSLCKKKTPTNTFFLQSTWLYCEKQDLHIQELWHFLSEGEKKTLCYVSVPALSSAPFFACSFMSLYHVDLQKPLCFLSKKQSSGGAEVAKNFFPTSVAKVGEKKSPAYSREEKSEVPSGEQPC